VTSTHCKHPLLTSHIIAGSVLGWAFVTRLEMPPHFKVLLGLSQLYMAFRSKAYKHHTTGDKEHLIPRSHRFQAQISLSERQGSPPSVKTTIDRQHLQGTQQSRWISKWLFDEQA
jgi:hypothetical protein